MQLGVQLMAASSQKPYLHSHALQSDNPNKPTRLSPPIDGLALAKRENTSKIYTLHWDNSDFGEYAKLVNRFSYD